MIGGDHERNLREACVGERAQDIVEKRAAVQAHHRLEAGVRGALLLLRELRARVGLAHPCPKAASEHDGAGCAHAEGEFASRIGPA